jgi:phosphohistidine swiveling domain-containing protein
MTDHGSTQHKAELTFTPPGPGPWELDAVHFPRPVTRYWTEMHPSAFAAGFADMTAFYGLPFDTRVMTYVNGFAYGQVRPLPPDEIPARFARAAEVWERKVWREQIEEWNDIAKPAAIDYHRGLQAIDPDLLSDTELTRYLRRCRDHHSAMITQHMKYTGTAVIPPSDLLVHALEWTGLPASQLLGLMRGASQISGGASSESRALVEAFRADPAALDRVHGHDEPGKLLDEMRHEDTDAGRALSDYLDVTGYRLLDGFDISGRYALELPDVLLRSILSLIERSDSDESDEERALAEVRRRVPSEHLAEFDSLLDEARAGYSIRDERGVYSDIWASGLMRRAAMAGARRLAARGRLHHAEHFVFAGIDEMAALLSDSMEPTADELAARYTFHKTYTAKDAPVHLGDEPPPMPDPSQLPPGAGRVLRAMGLGMAEMFGVSSRPHEETVIRGLAASTGVREGPARRVEGPSDFDRIKQGDVVITEATTEAFNILLPLLAGIVTDSGGALSHAAIVAREYGIPGVVGTRDATSRIADGVWVSVNGDTGEVTVLG